MYDVIIQNPAKKDLRKVPEAESIKLVRKIRSLSDNPRPEGCKKLTGYNLWRIRSGDYRVIYGIDDKDKNVFIEYIRHRKDAYRL